MIWAHAIPLDSPEFEHYVCQVLTYNFEADEPTRYDLINRNPDDYAHPDATHLLIGPADNDYGRGEPTTITWHGQQRVGCHTLTLLTARHFPVYTESVS